MAQALSHNRKAGFDIEVQDKYEAGLVLSGDEIKSIRAGRVQLTGSYIKLMRGSKRNGELPEAIMIGAHLGLAGQPDRSRKLLLHAKELREIEGALSAKGKVAVPLSIYLKRGWAKVSIGVGVGRKSYDKRTLLRNRDIERSQRRELKNMK
ncbi:MAG: smpB, SsrA-binding protein [Patescibacteria group bacterium]|jgi:SsrA-binding protein|nr:smpB, SsrA-binding protein [Patescibacteria group bacterium]